MNKSTNPIGLFDSGVGGTSIWREIHNILPNENTIYLADSKNAPYGQKSKEEIIELSIKNTEFLLNQNCKMIVVACNTATTNAIKELRTKFDIPFIGIEPAIKPAANSTQTQTIGILATQGTLNSELFHKAVLDYKDIKIVEQVGHGLVKLIEEGSLESAEMKKLLQDYLTPMIKANIDYLVLGCSHYPYLIPQIKEILPETVKIIDSGLAVARQTKNVLVTQDILNNSLQKGNTLFYTNSTPKVLSSILENKYEVEERDF
ncbi:glutamate racemase [Flavobacterium sp. C4GT6]|uniref:glutamate racemase n=1 Tax=Flavobacterium sp. C4GT6 TaxID=3103818 RepID=UPI002ED4B98A